MLKEFKEGNKLPNVISRNFGDWELFWHGDEYEEIKIWEVNPATELCCGKGFRIQSRLYEKGISTFEIMPRFNFPTALSNIIVNVCL